MKITNMKPTIHHFLLKTFLFSAFAVEKNIIPLQPVKRNSMFFIFLIFRSVRSLKNCIGGLGRAFANVRTGLFYTIGNSHSLEKWIMLSPFFLERK